MTSQTYACTRCGIIRMARRPGPCQSCQTSEGMQRAKAATPAPDWTGSRCYANPATDDNGVEDPWFPILEVGKNRTSIDWETPRAECIACPLLDACGEWALSDPDPTAGEGMWGGMTPDERAQFRAATKPAATVSVIRPNNPTSDPRCGQYKGVKAHRERGEQFCDPCRRAKNDYENARKRRQRAAARLEDAS